MTNEDVVRRVAGNVEALRRQRGWSGAELARRASLSARTVANVEAGANATLATLVAIADALELPLQEVLFGEPAGSRPARPAAGSP
jgi:transcriptional regulator with XRE-family HTH domain